MDDLQREVKALQDDLAAGRITIDTARTWCVTMANDLENRSAAVLNRAQSLRSLI